MFIAARTGRGDAAKPTRKSVSPGKAVSNILQKSEAFRRKESKKLNNTLERMVEAASGGQAASSARVAPQLEQQVAALSTSVASLQEFQTSMQPLLSQILAAVTQNGAPATAAAPAPAAPTPAAHPPRAAGATRNSARRR